MFSGKTEELIRRVRRAYYSKKSVIVFKHALDIRYKKSRVTSHNGISIRSKIVHGARDILKKVNARTQIVAIDEAMWFGTDLIEVVSKLVSDGKRVIVSGLSVTFTKEPFEPIPTLMALADKVDKFSALCTRCGNEAVFHKKYSPTRTFVVSR
ncbi:thymidine kinase [Candidatus Woesearchaeota archaeon]|nr:thymidine kinase [Candidatus Woesearchaeota archaeon]